MLVLNSFYEKVKSRNVTHNPDLAFERITDTVGLRLVCNSLRGIKNMCDWIDALDAKGAIQICGDRETHAKPGGYRSVHYVVHICADRWPGINTYDNHLDEVPVEIQIRTVLEEAWGEVEHRYGYKSDSAREMDSVIRFKALSERLHGIDLDLASLIADERRVKFLSVYVPSYEIDPHKLHFEDSTQEKETKQRLENAAAARARGEHLRAAKMYLELYSDTILAPHLESIRATADFRCEEAFAYLLRGRELVRAGRRDDARGSLEKAEELYRKASESPGGDHCLFVPWRTAEIRALLEDHREAVRLARDAVSLFDRLEAEAPGKTSRFDRHPVRRGVLLRSVGAHYEAAWRDGGLSSDFEEAESTYSESVASLKKAAEAAPRSGPSMTRLSLELLKTYNRLIYINYLHYRKGPRNSERLRRAKDLISEVLREVDGDEKEQLIEFLDTCLAVGTADLDESGSLEELVELDTKYRRRLISQLGYSKPQLRLDEMEEVLSHLEEFHEKWKQRVLDTCRSPQVEEDSAT